MLDKDQQICQLLMYICYWNPNNARIYYEKRLRYYVEPTTLFHTALLNAGEEYANNKDYNNALAYYNESGILFKKLNYEIGTAYNIGGNALCRNWVMKSNESDYISHYLLEKNRLYFRLPYLYV
jgi:hypothetical protein